MTAVEKKLCVATASLLVACTASPGRRPAGVIAGTLSDTTGVLMDEVSIRLRRPRRKADLQSALTDSMGRYVFSGVAPGDYELFVVVPAATAVRGKNPRPVMVGVNRTAVVDFTFDLLPVSFSRHVAPVLRGACTGCHSAAGGAPLGLILTGSRARAMTVGVKSVEHPGMKRIAPRKPDSSYLLYKLAGTHQAVGGVGTQMPMGFPPLSRQTIRMIERWIAEGARQN